MLTIRCSACRRKLLKYEKIGSGRVLRCWKSKIRKDFLIYKTEKVYCTCGQLIGIDGVKFIRMKQAAFVYSGTKQRA